MKNFKIKKLLPIMILTLFLMPLFALAFAAKNSDTVYIQKDQTIEGNFYTAGTTIIIDGHITGDLICAGQSITVTGTIDGDILCIGQALNLNGDIGGDVRVAGNNIRLNAEVARSLNAFGSNVEISSGANIGTDALIAAAGTQIYGDIGRSLLGAGANFFLNGNIGGDMVIYTDNMKNHDSSPFTITDSASIGGNLKYRSLSEGTISDKAEIGGETIHNFPKTKEKKSRYSLYPGFMLFGIISALLLAFVLMSLWKKPLLKITDDMTNKYWITIGWGAVLIILTPIICILLALTFIGLRLAVLIFLFWLALLVVSKIIAAIAIGRLFLKNFWVAKKDSTAWIVIFGITISWVIFYIPVIGWLLSAIATWWGAGSLITHLKHKSVESNISQ